MTTKAFDNDDLAWIGSMPDGSRSTVRSREYVYEAVKHAILSGYFEPRQRLIEDRLSKALQVSRTPIREALAILEHEGLIESIPYKGIMVKPVTVQEFLGMYEALGAVESSIARSAVGKIPPSGFLELGKILDDAERRIPDDVPGHLAACRAFQEQLGAYSDNPFLTRILVSIEERSDIYLIHNSIPLPPENMQAAVDDRRAILAAVERGDPDEAAKAAEAHARAIRIRWRDRYLNSDHSTLHVT